MKRIRIQNDIQVTWRIYRNGEEYNLTNKDIVVKLLDEMNRPAPITYSVSGNSIVVDFEGRNQSRTGEYTLYLCENPGKKAMTTIDKVKVFCLVRHSFEEGGTSNPLATVTTVETSSDIDVPSYQHPFSIDDNGILTVLATGKKYILTPYVAPATVVSTSYADPVVSLSYATIPAAGGTVSPTLTYSQVKTKTMSDGTVQTETITTGATVEYTGATSTNGSVTAGATQSTSVQTIASVTVKVTLNGKSATKTVAVKQAANLVSYDYYIGMVQSNASGFSALSADNLVANAAKKSLTQTFSASYLCKKSCFFMLIPTSHLSLGKMQFTSGGLTTDIFGTDGWNLQHDNITIGDTEYKVYGYRNGSLSDTNTITYDYQIKYTA